MPYVVSWVPRGPDISVRCHTEADVVALAAELKLNGQFSDLRIMRDDQEVDIASVARALEERGGLS